MVQVTSVPCDDEDEHFLPEKISQPTDVLDPTDDLKRHRKSSYTEEAYKNIISSLRADPLTITEPKLALNLLDTAIRIKSVPLAKQCSDILCNLLDKDNVLLVMLHISKCQKIPENDPNDFEPSAPPIVEEDNQRDEDWVQELIDNLRKRCLTTIDRNADFVLRHKEITELCYNDLLSIAFRDTLQVSNEMIVYSAVMRWGLEECKRRTLKPQLINVKAVLRDLVYGPRYGLMTKKDFLVRMVDGVKGPDRSGMLEESETENILNYIKKRGRKSSLEDLPFKMSQERREEKVKSGKNDEYNKVWDKCIVNFLRCFTAVFD